MPYKDYSSTMININNEAQDNAMNNLGAFLTGSILGGGRNRSAGPSQEARVLDQMKASQVQQEIGQVAAEDARMGRIDRLLTGQGMQNQPLEAMRRAQGLALGLDEKRRDSLGKQLAGMTALQGVTPAGQPAVPGQMSQEIADAYQVSQGIQNYGNTMTGTFNAPIKVNEGQNVAIAPAQQRATGMAPVLYGRAKTPPNPPRAKMYSYTAPDGTLVQGRTLDDATDMTTKEPLPQNAAVFSGTSQGSAAEQAARPGMYGSLSDTEKKEARQASDYNSEVTFMADDIINMVDKNRSIVGASGSAIKIISGIRGQYKDFMTTNKLAPEADFNLSAAQNLATSFAGDDAGSQAAVFHSAIIDLAYTLARSKASRVSNADFDNEIKGLAADMTGSADHMISVLRHKHGLAVKRYNKLQDTLALKKPGVTPLTGQPMTPPVVRAMNAGQIMDFLKQSNASGQSIDPQVKKAMATRYKALTGGI